LQERAEPAAPPVYPSKRDRWLEVVVWTTLLVSSSAGLVGFASRAGPRILAVPLTLCLVTPALLFWLFYGTNYALLPDELLVRSGPFRFHVPLAEITSVVPSRSPISSPACSLDRLEIRYRGDRSRILISPEDKVSFLEALLKRCDQLERRDDRLVLQGRA